MMQTLYRFPDGKFFDADYFERGRETGKGWLQNYRWMPRRSFREALAIVDHLGLDEASRVLDVGCAKGFIVRALRELEIAADGCDISEYALSFAPEGCWHCEDLEAWEGRRYTHAFTKDVFEHNTPEQLQTLLEAIAAVAPRLMAVVPMGDCGVYRIPEYHTEITHLIAENEVWWREAFKKAGWRVERETAHVLGIKDNWSYCPNGNRVFICGLT
jgi:cyclopropane fatty-acyl-phospholipid synthase-like methyltransferase